MARYVVDPQRSTVRAVARPVLGNDPGPAAISVMGAVEVIDGEPSGAITITLAGDPPPSLEVDLAGTRAELAGSLDPGDPEGALVLLGRTSRAASAFGIAGPPLLNPTVLLSWRVVLVPDQPDPDQPGSCADLSR